MTLDPGLQKLHQAALRIRDELRQAEPVLHAYSHARYHHKLGEITGLLLDPVHGLVVSIWFGGLYGLQSHPLSDLTLVPRVAAPSRKE